MTATDYENKIMAKVREFGATRESAVAVLGPEYVKALFRLVRAGKLVKKPVAGYIRRVKYVEA